MASHLKCAATAIGDARGEQTTRSRPRGESRDWLSGLKRLTWRLQPRSHVLHRAETHRESCRWCVPRRRPRSWVIGSHSPSHTLPPSYLLLLPPVGAEGLVSATGQSRRCAKGKKAWTQRGPPCLQVSHPTRPSLSCMSLGFTARCKSGLEHGALRLAWRQVSLRDRQVVRRRWTPRSAASGGSQREIS